MGANLRAVAEVFDGQKWKIFDKQVFFKGLGMSKFPFDFRNYAMYSFLGWDYNLNGIPCLSDPKGFPDDSEYLNSYSEEWEMSIREDLLGDPNNKCFTHFTLAELLNFDYNQEFEDLRVKEITVGDADFISVNGCKVEEKGFGKMRHVRDALGDSYFYDLDVLKTLGRLQDVRVIIWFD